MAEEKRQGKAMPHNVIMEGRKSLSVTGVTDIDSFDEELVVLYTDMGELSVRGVDLHINHIDVVSGELSLEGEIHSLSYDDAPPRKGGVFSRLFR